MANLPAIGYVELRDLNWAMMGVSGLPVVLLELAALDQLKSTGNPRERFRASEFPLAFSGLVLATFGLVHRAICSGDQYREQRRKDEEHKQPPHSHRAA